MILLHASHAKLTGDKILAAWQSLIIKTTQAHGKRQMTEKLTGLNHHDFVNLNVAITAVMKDYQRMIDNKSHIADYWAREIVKLKATKEKINSNRSYER